MRVLCLHCDGETLAEEPPATVGMRFFRCPACRRAYALAEGRALTERWLGPLSLILYPILFSRRPVDEAERVARQFLDGQGEARSSEQLESMLEAIRDELSRPTQRVRDILPFAVDEASVSEEDVRAFLQRFVEIVEKALALDLLL